MNHFFLSIFIFLSVQPNLLGFVEGTGGSYIFTQFNRTQIPLKIYIAKVTDSNLFIEYAFNDQLGINKYWQQYKLKLGDKVEMVEAYVQEGNQDKPRIVPTEFFQQNKKGVQLHHFLINKGVKIPGKKEGKEFISVPAGKVLCDHYQFSENSQVIDFWINEEVRPTGLVKLVSKGENNHHRYQIELKSLIKNQKSQIDPDKAISMPSDEQSKFHHTQKL